MLCGCEIVVKLEKSLSFLDLKYKDSVADELRMSRGQIMNGGVRGHACAHGGHGMHKQRDTLGACDDALLQRKACAPRPEKLPR